MADGDGGLHVEFGPLDAGSGKEAVSKANESPTPGTASADQATVRAGRGGDYIELNISDGDPLDATLGRKKGTECARKKTSTLNRAQLDQALLPEDRAEEIAARTVNKERARAGESQTRSRTSTRDMSSSRRGGLRSGTNRPTGRTRDQLYNEARNLGIKGRSSMNKSQLERAVERKKSQR